MNYENQAVTDTKVTVLLNGSTAMSIENVSSDYIRHQPVGSDSVGGIVEPYETIIIDWDVELWKNSSGSDATCIIGRE